MKELEANKVFLKEVDVVKNRAIFKGMARLVAGSAWARCIERFVVRDRPNIAIAGIAEEFQSVWDWDAVRV